MTYLSNISDITLQLKLPLAEDLFFRWFQNSNYIISISDGGRIAKQMLKQLGGVSGIWLLADEQIFDLIHKKFNYRKPKKSDELEKNLDESKVVNYDHLWGAIQRIANQSETYLYKTPEELFRKFLDSGIIQLGIDVSCKFCNQSSWYSIDEIKYDVRCTNCREIFSLPTHNPKNKLRWAYRTIGAFSPATEHYGSYAVLLALRFFAVTYQGKTTPIFGLEVKPKDSQVLEKKPPEADLALFFKKDFSLNDAPDLIFVECKMYNNPIAEKDITTMSFFAKSFPSSYFVFATLKKQLTPKEKKLIKLFAKNLKKQQKEDISKVIVLTGIELYSNKTPPLCWEGKIDEYSDSFQGLLMQKKLLGLCELTQKIHLKD